LESEKLKINSFNFILNESSKKDFISLLEKLYLQNINIKEYSLLGSRMFLFKENLSFNEIQEIKNKYQISW